ncbi:MAG: glycosyltransferase family 4 protein [Acidobacteriia bacterium]|nr:glycosyltransferase family 4 protein [Terriglobia bacterium]
MKALTRQHDVDLFTVHYGEAPHAGTDLPRMCRNIFQYELRKSQNTASRAWRCIAEDLPRVIEHFNSTETAARAESRLQVCSYSMAAADELCMAPYVKSFDGPRLIMRQKIDCLHFREVASKQRWGKEKLLQLLEVQKLCRYERRTLGNFHAGVCCSESDAGVLRELNAGMPLTVIPNGVDFNYFTSQLGWSGPPTVLYIGTMNYYPNIDAVHYFFEAIYPHLKARVPEVRINVVGHNPPPEILNWAKFQGVQITGSVPDIRPYLKECHVCIVPLRLGGGTRLKIMESIAVGRPVVSTSVGAEGIGMKNREHLMVADDPELFAEHTAELLRNPELGRALIEKARPYVQANFSWSVLGEQFEAACRRLVESRSH